MPPDYIVSACLAGIPCRYDGGRIICSAVQRLVKEGRALPLCPEALAELPVPRPPCEWRGKRIISSTGEDCTEAFQRGARLALEISLCSGAKAGILKSRSPSCGCGQIYDGTFSHHLISGNGCWAQLLLAAGMELYSEEKLPPELSRRVFPPYTTK